MAILPKLKQGLKKIIQGVKNVQIKKPVQEKGRQFSDQEKALGFQEMKVEQAKFYYPQPAAAVRVMPADLPLGYGQDMIVLQVRDPWWIHAYWEVTGETLDRLRKELQDEFHKAKRILRIYDVSHIDFNGKNAHRYFDIQITQEANNWYIDTNGPGRSWIVDLGLLLPDGRFIMILRSNTVHTPIEGPSWITDEEWMIPDDVFARLYGMGFGLGKSSPVGKAWQERIKKELLSGIGITSVTSPVKKDEKKRKFWFVVDTELIVYGATEPDAKVYVQDKKINLRPDGTFTLRFALPNGKQVIPIKAVSGDNLEERTITPIISKETK